MAEYLGFITDVHQINVGITRSKYGLVITGISSVFACLWLLRHLAFPTGNKTLLAYSKTWEELLIDYDAKGCVVDQETHFALPKSPPKMINLSISEAGQRITVL